MFPSVQANKHGDVYVTTFGHNQTESDVATSWFARADARPNFGDYNSSELLGFNQFVQVWADGRFPNLGQAGPTTNPLLRQTTPDTIFGISQGLGVGGG